MLIQDLNFDEMKEELKEKLSEFDDGFSFGIF